MDAVVINVFPEAAAQAAKTFAEMIAAILVLSAVLTKHVPKLLAQLLPRHQHQQLRPHH